MSAKFETRSIVEPGGTGRLRIVVYGYIVRGPLGGFAWHHMQYVTGLRKLGHAVVFVEDGGSGDDCYDPSAGLVSADATAGLRFAEDAFAGVGCGSHWAYFDRQKGSWHGPRAADVSDFCASADLLINLNDPSMLPPWLERIPVRVLIDTDPVFMQVRCIQDPQWRAAVAQHTVLFTFGERVGSGTSDCPSDGFTWLPTRQPTDLDLWPHLPGRPSGAWTTIMQWTSYAPIEHRGMRYGMKSDAFGPMFGFPSMSSESLEIAMGSASAPREALRAAGWSLVDPLVVSESPWSYQRYIQESKGELSVAKHGYVAAGSGWFSERTACYLATGRPAIVQDTGFSSFLPTREGLLAFTTPQEALAQLDEARTNYERHCLAAREVAVEFFDGTRVLSSLIDRSLTGLELRSVAFEPRRA